MSQTISREPKQRPGTRSGATRVPGSSRKPPPRVPAGETPAPPVKRKSPAAPVRRTGSPPKRGPAMHQRFRERRLAVRAAGLRSRRRLLRSLFVLAAVTTLAVCVSLSPLFAIQDVTVTGVDQGRAEAVRLATGILPGSPLLTADLGAARTEVEQLAFVASADVRRVPPSTVEVAIRLREPQAVVRLAGSSWIVDAEGTVLHGGGSTDLVTVQAPGARLPGVGEQATDPTVTVPLRVHAELPPDLRALVERYETGAGGLRGYLRRLDSEGNPAPLVVRFGTAAEVPAKGQALQLLLDRITADPALAASEIDVRAPGNPVLVPAR